MRLRWLLPLVLGLVASVASATTVLRVSVEELSRKADVIVRGRVEDVRVVTDAKDERRITTLVTLRVDVVLKGHATGPRLTLRLAGGRTDRWDATIPGTPVFVKGEEAVVFLEATSDGLKPSGLAEGKYSLRSDPATGRLRATRSLDGAAVLVRHAGGLAAEGAVSHPDDDLDAGELLQRIGRGARTGGAR